MPFAAELLVLCPSHHPGVARGRGEAGLWESDGPGPASSSTDSWDKARPHRCLLKQQHSRPPCFDERPSNPPNSRFPFQCMQTPGQSVHNRADSLNQHLATHWRNTRHPLADLTHCTDKSCHRPRAKRSQARCSAPIPLCCFPWLRLTAEDLARFRHTACRDKSQPSRNPPRRALIESMLHPLSARGTQERHSCAGRQLLTAVMFSACTVRDRLVDGARRARAKARWHSDFKLRLARIATCEVDCVVIKAL